MQDDLREALNEIITNGRWTDGEQRGEWAITKEVYEMAAEALSRAAREREKAGMAKMGEWRAIDTAPKDGTHILAYGCCHDVHPSDVGGWHQREVWCKWNNHFQYVQIAGDTYRREPCRVDEHWAPSRKFHPTHWQPLPDPPAENGRRE